MEEAMARFGEKLRQKGKDAVAITTEVVVKKPVPERLSRPYFTTPDGKLTRRNGAQPDIPGMGKAEDMAAKAAGLADDETVDDDGVVTKFRKK
jgi:hypothetical protein